MTESGSSEKSPSSGDKKDEAPKRPANPPSTELVLNAGFKKNSSISKEGKKKR